MFTNYEIKNIGGEDVLYLYMSFQYEFSKELTDLDDIQLKNISQQFIKANRIPFRGNLIYLVVDGFIVKKVNLNYKDYEVDPRYMADHYSILIKQKNHQIITVSLREFLLSALLSFYSDYLGDEVLKAICVLFNSYAYEMMNSNHSIPSNNSFLEYSSFSSYQNKFSNFDSIIKRLNHIINDCQGIYLSYYDEIVLPFIHFSNGGETLDNKKYPYLSKVKSLWDLASSNYIHVLSYSYHDLNEKFKISLSSSSSIRIVSNTGTIYFGEKCFSLNEVKSTLNLPSSDFCIIVNKDNLEFITKGVGNSLGLSIYGSTCMEKNGCYYYQILGYYFPKCKIYRMIKGLS